MTGTPRETPQPPTASVKSYDRPSTLSLLVLGPGRARAAGLGVTCSLDTPSAWSTSSVEMTSRLSPWPMVGGGPATGGRDSDAPSNFRMQRSALRAAADPAR
jgi:hypothetical protein